MLKMLRCVCILLLWISLAALARQALLSRQEFAEYDPYAILELDRGAEIAEIKKQYRRLSMEHHPDRGGDPQKFVTISKAYEALTDEDVRKNWEMYNNPDGPQAMRLGIALPSALVRHNSILALAAYGIVFLLVLPLTVRWWWNRSIQYGSTQVLMETSRRYVWHIGKRTNNMTMKNILFLLSTSPELSKEHNKDIVERESDQTEIPEVINELDDYELKDKYKYKPYIIKANALLYAHLNRLELPEKTLDVDLQTILKLVPMLLQEMVNQIPDIVSHARRQEQMAKAGAKVSNFERFYMPKLSTLENIMKTSQAIVQAHLSTKDPLLQLPHFTPTMRSICARRRRQPVKTCADLAALPEEERKQLLRSTTSDQYTDILHVLHQMPKLHMEVEYKVLAENDMKRVTTESTVTVCIRLHRSPLLGVDALNAARKDYAYSSETSCKSDEYANTGASSGTPSKTYVPLGNVADNDEADLKDESGDELDRENGQVDKGDNQEEADKENTALAPAVQKRKVWELNKKKKSATSNKRNHKKPAKQPPKQIVTKVVPVVPKATEESQEHQDSESDKEEQDKEDKGSATDEEYDSEEEQHEADREIEERLHKHTRIPEAKSLQSHSVHSPYFPGDKQEWWWIYLVDKKENCLASTVTKVTNLTNEWEGEIQFLAPKQPAKVCVYQVWLRSDSYLGCDMFDEIKFEVHEAPPPEKIDIDQQGKKRRDDADKESDKSNSEEDEEEYTEDDSGSDSDGH